MFVVGEDHRGGARGFEVGAIFYIGEKSDFAGAGGFESCDG